ncbi:MAG TPA: succinate dehydrogenase, hydrophobic membrane anchor protein [Ktedonobacter sp.]|nr:succinate dehydrogenase, hydrophobic membrane anchor protein [Ktedonobacter sp.]
MRISTGYGAKPASSGFETFSWFFFRVSGVLLIFLVIIHLIIMHVTNDVSCTTYQFVAMRYDNPLWRLYDWLLLTLSLLHGMNGLRVVIDDYIRGRSARLTLMSVAGTLTLIFFMLGTITLITFQHAGNLGVTCLHH